MSYQTQKTVLSVGGGSTLTDIVKENGIYGEKAFRTYRIKVKVMDAQAEMTEFIRFTEEVAKHRSSGTLTVDKEDPSTYPSFIIQYPKESVDGSYFIIKCYTVTI